MNSLKWPEHKPMKNIKRFEQYVNESYLSGSKAPLSHSTNVWYAKDILDTNVLKKQDTGTTSVVSLTRDPNFTYMDLPVTFVLDADKLSSNYKIVPFDYMNFEPEGKANPERKGDFEYEETVDRDIKNLDRYITEIRFNPSIDKIRNAPLNTKEEWRESYEDLIKAIIKYKEDNYSNKLKVFFKGKEVDDEFLKNEINPITEGIYKPGFNNKIYVSKAADQKNYKVYYSSYKPMIEFKKHLDNNGINHIKYDDKTVTMDKENVDKLKKSFLNLK